MSMKERFGSIVVDGKVINLDSASVEELEKYEKKLDEEIEKNRDSVMEFVTED